MKEPRDEFLEQIKSTLLGHEEPYDEGAWERFAAKNISTAKKEKPVVPIWKWAAAAAAVLIGAILLLQYFNAPDTLKELGEGHGPIVKTEAPADVSKDSQSAYTDTTKESTVVNAENLANQNNVPKNNEIKSGQYVPSPMINEILAQKEVTAKPDNTEVTTAPPVIISQQPAQQQQAIAKQPIQQQPAQKPADKPFWQNQVEQQQGIAKNPAPQNNNVNTNGNNAVAGNRRVQTADRANVKTGKWLSSLYVSPNFGTTGVNMGYGYSLGYAINNKVRVSSGIAYTKVSASKDFDAPEPPNTLAMDNNTIRANAYSRSVAGATLSGIPSAPYIQSMESWISGIDVPVEITYDVSKKVYASGGVSGLFVMKGENTRKMVSDLNSIAPVVNSQGDVKGYSNLSEESKPRYEKSEHDGTPFLGFYNVSMGYKQKISNKNSVSLEPFVKIPMKQVSDQKLNYTGVGVRLKFDF